MPASLVITSASAVTPYGLGVHAFAEGIANGPVRFEPQGGGYAAGALLAKVPPYDARALLSARSICNFDRLTLHVCVAADQLYKSIGLGTRARQTVALAGNRVSFVCGTSGPLQSIIEIDLQTIEEPGHLRPSRIPNFVFSTPASYAAIRHGIRGSCITLTDGDTSSLQAFALASAQLKANRIDFALVGGAEEATPAYALYRAALPPLAGPPAACASGQAAPACEGAAILTVERAEHAGRAGRASLAALIGCAHVFSPADGAAGLAACLQKLRRQCGKQLDRVGVVCAEAAVDLAALGLAQCRRLTLFARMGETGAMYGVLAVLNALTCRDVGAGELVLVLQASREGACAAVLVQKHQKVPARRCKCSP